MDIKMLTNVIRQENDIRIIKVGNRKLHKKTKYQKIRSNISIGEDESRIYLETSIESNV